MLRIVLKIYFSSFLELFRLEHLLLLKDEKISDLQKELELIKLRVDGQLPVLIDRSVSPLHHTVIDKEANTEQYPSADIGCQYENVLTVTGSTQTMIDIKGTSTETITNSKDISIQATPDTAMKSTQTDAEEISKNTENEVSLTMEAFSKQPLPSMATYLCTVLTS